MGMETPSYTVFRDLSCDISDDPYMFGIKNVGSWDKPFYRFGGTAGRGDPWADYRHGKISDLNPSFNRKTDA